MAKVWGIHNDAIPASRLVAEGFVSIGWDETGDLRLIGDDQAAMREAVTKAYPDGKPGAFPVWAGMLRRFAYELKPGDLVVAPSKQSPVYNIGKVVGAYEYVADAPNHRHRLPIEWLVVDQPKSLFSQAARNELGSAVTLFQVSTGAPEIEAVVAGERPDSVADPDAQLVRYGLLQRTILQLLADEGPLQAGRVIQRVAEEVDLTESELAPGSDSGVARYDAACRWGSVDMVAAGWLERTKEGWAITDAGRQRIADPNDDTDISKISSVAYREQAAQKRREKKRFSTPIYPLIDEAVKMIPEGRWSTYSDIAVVVGTNPPSVGEYVHNVELDGHYRVIPVGRAPYQLEWQQALEGEGVLFNSRGLPDPTKHFDADELRRELIEQGFLDAPTAAEMLGAGKAPELKPATDELAASLHVSLEWLQECLELLVDRPQLIFYGPPGTGKTYLAQAIGRHIAGENVKLVQFHPAYSYEDFFEGFRPTPEGGFVLKPGPLRRVVRDAIANPTQPYVLVIDEINRGNLAKVFGELYFLLEYRSEQVDLMYSDEPFRLPRNVFIIGTMNTADRSIALVDAAMRRRFSFLPLHPNEEPTKSVLRSWLRSSGHDGRPAAMLDELNRRIEDADFKVGPSYFMRDRVQDVGGLELAWRTSVLPLLEEHHYGELTSSEVSARYGYAAVASAISGAQSESDENDQP